MPSQKSNLVPRATFLKTAFLPSPYGEKMRLGWGWPKQLYALFIVKTWHFTERDLSKDLTLQRNYDKDFKITSLSQYCWLYCKIWKCFCLLRIILENTTPNNFSKSRKFSREVSAVEFCYSWAIVSMFHCNFIYVSEAFDFMELFHYGLRNFTPDLLSSQPQFNLKYTE